MGKETSQIFLEIQRKKEELRTANEDKTDTSVLQSLISVFSGERIAQFLMWEAESKANNGNREQGK